MWHMKVAPNHIHQNPLYLFNMPIPQQPQVLLKVHTCNFSSNFWVLPG